MAIVITGLFWALCYGVGSAYGFLNAKMQNSNLIAVTPFNESVISIDNMGDLYAWDESNSQWNLQTDGEMEDEERVAKGIVVWMDENIRQGPLRLPPVYDSKTNRIYTAVTSLINPLNRDHQDFYVADADELEFKRVGKFPRDAMAMYNTDKGLLVVTASGRFVRFDVDDIPNSDFNEEPPTPVEVEKVDSEMTETTSEPGEIAEKKAIDQEKDKEDEEKGGIAAKKTEKKDRPKRKQRLEDLAKRVGPDSNVAVRRGTTVAYNYSNEEIAIFAYEGGKPMVFVFKLEGDSYVQHRSVEIDTGTSTRIRCQVEYQANTILVVVGNGQVITLDAETMKEKNGYTPETSFPISTVSASRDGRWFALHYENQTLWLLDTQNDSKLNKPSVRGQGTISGAGFDGKGELWVVDRTDRVTTYDPESLAKSNTFSPSGDLIKNTYRYAVKPFYTFCPKPSEFYKVVTHLSETGNAKDNLDVDLTRGEKASDPFAPLWSGVLFMVAMLFLACTIFHFKDY